MTELVCRLISLHLRRGTPVEEVIRQCTGIQEMQPWPNLMPDGSSVYVTGLGDGIARVLRHLADQGLMKTASDSDPGAVESGAKEEAAA